MCVMAAGSWEPVVAGEYLMSEWILSLGRLSTVCTLAQVVLPSYSRTGTSGVVAGEKELYQNVKGKCACTITAAQLLHSGTARTIEHFSE